MEGPRLIHAECVAAMRKLADPEIEQIGNDHTKTRKTQIRCRQCALKMIVGAITNSVAWTREKVISRWNKRTGTA